MVNIKCNWDLFQVIEFCWNLSVAGLGFSWGGCANFQIGIISPKTAWKWKNLDPQKKKMLGTSEIA